MKYFWSFIFCLSFAWGSAQEQTSDYQKNYYDTGELQSEGLFVKGQQQGLWIYYFRDGKKRIEKEMKDGKPHGKSLWFHPNGTLGWEENYKDGQAEGSFIYYDRDGSVQAIKEFREGKEISYTVKGILQR